MATPPLPGIEHVVLLMFENRSFDNVLGALYPATADGGGVPKGFSNPWPGSPDVAAWSNGVGSAAWIIPYPDPNELYANMSAQIHEFGHMKGFVADYVTAAAPGHPVKPPNIMQFFQPGNVPVTAALAQTYMAGDRYFASGPVQTWPNRLFSLCGTAGFDPATKLAYLNNTDYPGYANKIPISGQLPWLSIFEQLDNAGQTWKVYFDDEAPISAIIQYVYDHWWKIDCGGNVWPLSYTNEPWCQHTFFKDVEKGSLPSFTLLEPRYQMDSAYGDQAPTSNHPGSSSAIDDYDAPISVSCGERLLAQVYNALVAQPALFAKTLLVVTYDEHGGLFDHVYPPNAPTPFKPSDGVKGFDYDVYGVRVPTLFINPYVAAPGKLFRASECIEYPLDHTSLLKTLRDQWDLEKNSSPLSARIASVPTLRGLIDPNVKPIQPKALPVPDCVWSSSGALKRREGAPVSDQAFWSALQMVRKSRHEGGR